jgi:hypothetical protein
MKTSWPKQAAATHLGLGVATSPNKIANALALYFCAASLYHPHWFVRESWLWHVLLPRLDSDSYQGDALQYAKKIFQISLQLMTCENIPTGYLCVVTTVFSQQDGISIFEFPTRFLEIFCRDLTSSLTSLSNLSN